MYSLFRGNWSFFIDLLASSLVGKSNYEAIFTSALGEELHWLLPFYVQFHLFVCIMIQRKGGWGEGVVVLGKLQKKVLAGQNFGVEN